MKQYDLNLLKQFLQGKDQNQLLKYFSSLPEKFKLLCITYSLQHSHKIQIQLGEAIKGKATELKYISLLLGIEQMQKLEQKIKRKGSWTEQEMKLADQLQTEKFIQMKQEQKQKRNKKGKKEKLIKLRYYNLIKKLKSEGLGWRQISEYIAFNHKQKISHNYLRQVFTKIEGGE